MMKKNMLAQKSLPQTLFSCFLLIPQFSARISPAQRGFTSSQNLKHFLTVSCNGHALSTLLIALMSVIFQFFHKITFLMFYYYLVQAFSLNYKCSYIYVGHIFGFKIYQVYHSSLPSIWRMIQREIIYKTQRCINNKCCSR